MIQIGKRIAATMFVSVLLVLLLSLVPVLQSSSQLEGDLPVFKKSEDKVITMQNLVDFLMSLSLTGDLKTADWTERALYLELTYPEQTIKEKQWTDLRHLVQSAFVEKENIETIFVTIYQRNEVQMSFEADKSAIDKQVLMKNMETDNIEPFLRKYFQLKDFTNP
ncbi:hypothetical protein IC620_04550 [Hazenella sp. IB182357]|uniref:Uncharacterized protein n=1 Tax=Polycladospora coralii TaxID=2771432 RepID=A0A926RTQ2_9BACL|nr:hypothetical protein [Polycladospora coralii]MBD1371627.1 hypothetical protein [Polycladospora coralii]MBS7529094.1 hypothetical protein [Polycladospora coralii]